MRQKVAFSRSGGTVSLEGTLLRGNPNVSDRVVVQIHYNTVGFLHCTAQKEAFEERRAGPVPTSPVSQARISAGREISVSGLVAARVRRT